MQSEIDALSEMNTRILVKPRPGRSVVPTKWVVYNLKRDRKGNVIRQNARLVAQNCEQIGVDSFQIFSPVSRYTTLRLDSSFSAKHNWSRASLDIKEAFVTAEFGEEIYVTQPEGYLKGMGNSCLFIIDRLVWPKTGIPDIQFGVNRVFDQSGVQAF